MGLVEGERGTRTQSGRAPERASGARGRSPGEPPRGRVGASLLLAAGLPELIADSLPEYAARLLDLVAKPAQLTQYRDYLERTRYDNPLFDTAGFARDWEALLTRIYDTAVGPERDGG